MRFLAIVVWILLSIACSPERDQTSMKDTTRIDDGGHVDSLADPDQVCDEDHWWNCAPDTDGVIIW